MSKGIGTFLIILLVMWFVAPTQTAHMVDSVMTAITTRIDQAANK